MAGFPELPDPHRLSSGAEPIGSSSARGVARRLAARCLPPQGASWVAVRPAAPFIAVGIRQLADFVLDETASAHEDASPRVGFCE